MPAQLSAQRRSGSAASSPSTLSYRDAFVAGGTDGDVINIAAQNGSSPELNGLGANIGVVHTPRSNVNLNPTTHHQHTRASPEPGTVRLPEAPSFSSSEARMAPRFSQDAPGEPDERASTPERDIRRAQLLLPHTPFAERPSQFPQPFDDVSPSPEINFETTPTPDGTTKEGRPRSTYGYFGYGATTEQAANGSQPMNPTTSNTSVHSTSARATGMNTPSGRRKVYPTVLKNVEREMSTDGHGRRQSVYRESDMRTFLSIADPLPILHMTDPIPLVNQAAQGLVSDILFIIQLQISFRISTILTIRLPVMQWTT
jgi:hypothetical protein